jgi:hypothetical protein
VNENEPSTAKTVFVNKVQDAIGVDTSVEAQSRNLRQLHHAWLFHTDFHQFPSRGASGFEPFVLWKVTREVKTPFVVMRKRVPRPGLPGLAFVEPPKGVVP